jgi:hypothetical protein
VHRGVLDRRLDPAHDRGVESPSLFTTIIHLPGDLIRLPSTTLATLEALHDLADRLDRLMTLLETVEGGVNMAGTGLDLATLGITGAVSGLQQAVGTLDTSLPSLSDSASALWNLTERLSGVAIELVNGLPWATRSPQDTSPEIASVAELLDERFTDLDSVVSDMARLVEAVVDTIPGMRGVIRINSAPFEADPRPEDP